MSQPSTWSETLVFIGAGATALLGMPQTGEQTDFFRKLSESSGRKELANFAKGFAPKDLNRLEDFLILLGDDKDVEDCWLEITDDELTAARRAYGSAGVTPSDEILKKRILELRHSYDWQALKQIISICPHDEEEDNLIRDVYTLLDKKMNAKQGIKVRAAISEKDEIVIDYSRLKGAYACVICFTVILFAKSWKNLVEGEKAEMFSSYKKFAETFARLMQKESFAFAEKYPDLTSREFYQFSTSFVSFNFETVFMWLLFNANREVNHFDKYLKTAQKVEQWLDFGFQTKSRKISSKSEDRKSEKFSYSYDEVVAFRQNECKASGSPVGRIGKFFFAHGSSNWRECPACGRMMYYLGDEWGYDSKHLNPPLPVPLFENDNFNRTENEKRWRNESLQSDALECVSCGAKTFVCNSPMIMQTMIKGTPTSFLEEVQREVRVGLEKCRHVVLLGYSLPVDDVVWIQTFTEAIRCRINSEEQAYCSVVVGYKGEKRWMYGEELKRYADTHRYEKEADAYGAKAIESAISIFGAENVRAYCGGIPQVWGDATENELKEILYPQSWNANMWKGTRLEK